MLEDFDGGGFDSTCSADFTVDRNAVRLIATLLYCGNCIATDSFPFLLPNRSWVHTRMAAMALASDAHEPTLSALSETTCGRDATASYAPLRPKPASEQIGNRPLGVAASRSKPLLVTCDHRRFPEGQLCGTLPRLGYRSAGSGAGLSGH